MSKGLDKQVYIYSVGTESFYTDKENILHNKITKLHLIKSKSKAKIDKIDKELSILHKNDEKINELNNKKCKYNNINTRTTKLLNKYKHQLKELLSKHKGIRTLRNDTLKDNKKIGMFSSALTRTIGMREDDLSTDLFVIRAYYYDVFKELIEDGFVFNDEKYIYFSSSAGQIRTKKAVFIKESLWIKHEGALTCGLSLEEINEKDGMNINKLLAYKALTASASTKWNNFDIDKCVVVPDLESNVTSVFDYFDRNTYEITRQEMTVPIEHTDGCGMILPKKSKKSFMFRLPYFKGLLVPFPFDEFAKECGNTKITDIYGKEWDIIDDDIQIVFTKSQFKMKSFYSDWDDYKKRFKDNNCQAVKLNEEDIGEQANLNYQMLQTLTDITTKELKAIAQKTVDDILRVGSDKDTMLRILGATNENKRKNYYQQALHLYPELLNDEHSKKIIKDKKKSMVNEGRTGKLKINGYYIFLIPDLYAFCERLFLGIKEPNGLLMNGEVYTNVFEEGKVNLLRSPHLYKEHCIRNNVRKEGIEKWFVTKGIYTSVKDPISRILQFDNDGDKSLVIQDELFIKVAERNMEGIVPLYYEMESAKGGKITNEKIYESLLLAFKANIGEVSNNITKVFNSKNPDLQVVKWLTAENNYIIDYAKTLYMPTRPDDVDKQIKEYIKTKVPYFFIEAKDKEKDKVEPLNNSTVNRLRKIIPNKRIKFEDVAGEFNYKILMSEEVKNLNHDIINRYEQLEREKRKLIRSEKHRNRREGQFYVDKYIREELLKVHNDENRIVNVLVEYLYGERTDVIKTTLWDSFGDILVMNIKGNLNGTKQCENCGTRIEVINNKVKYCDECAEVINREKTKERMRELRKNV